MVNIYEQAIKPVVDLEDGVTVYVPGYSYIGPEEPTLCSSVSEFEGLFGSSPYLFESDYEESGVTEGSPEKGYLYAKSLLSSGLKVLFHRYKGGEVGTAGANLKIVSSLAGEEISLKVEAKSFGVGYDGIKVILSPRSNNLYNLIVENSDGTKASEGLISLDPQNSLYFKLLNSPLIKFKAERGEIEDSILLKIAKAGDGKFTTEGGVDLNEGNPLTLDCGSTTGAQFSPNEMLTALAKTGSDGLMYPLLDFEKYPSVAYITAGGYYTDNFDVASAQLSYAEKISAIALVDLNLGIKSDSTWASAKASLSGISGSTTAKGKAAHFCGCNSFNLSPYRVVLGDSFNYLKCLGENMKKGIAPWLPVANDPNGVSPLGYDTTQKISTALAETIAESEIGVSSNPLIYSTSAGGYKIMGNRTLLSNDGVLSPNSFLNIAVIVNRVARSARQIANKLKIVSTDPNGTFLKFKQSVARTIEPMLVNQDGVLEYKIRHLPKTAPATMNIQIHLVVLEGIEKFNIYIPYELKLD